MTFYSGAYMDLKRRKAGLKLSKCPDDDGGKGPHDWSCDQS